PPAPPLLPYSASSHSPRSSSFNDPPPPHISTLSLHDALPISLRVARCPASGAQTRWTPAPQSPTPAHDARPTCHAGAAASWQTRSEEHTSELQSLTNLVCRLLLEKKKSQTPYYAPATNATRPP